MNTLGRSVFKYNNQSKRNFCCGFKFPSPKNLLWGGMGIAAGTLFVWLWKNNNSDSKCDLIGGSDNKTVLLQSTLTRPPKNT